MEGLLSMINVVRITTGNLSQSGNFLINSVIYVSLLPVPQLYCSQLRHIGFQIDSTTEYKCIWNKEPSTIYIRHILKH